MGNLIDTEGLDQYTDEITTFTSGDSSSPSSFTTIPVVASKEKPSSLFQKLSQAIANIRWLNNNKRGSGAFNAQNDTVTFTTADVSSDSSATSWTSVSQLTSGSTFSTLMNRISAMMKNTRYLYNKLMNTEDLTSSLIYYGDQASSTFYELKVVRVGNHVFFSGGVRPYATTTGMSLFAVPYSKGIKLPSTLGDGCFGWAVQWNSSSKSPIGHIYCRIPLNPAGTTVSISSIDVSFAQSQNVRFSGCFPVIFI